MDKPRADILQVRKYLNGELDAKAMHQLEREAQDDPFLMDALEGYEMAGKDQQHNLSVLRAQLTDRTRKPVRRIIPWAMISVAACTVGFLIVVGLLYKANNPNLRIHPQTTQLTPVKIPRVDSIAIKSGLANKNTDIAALKPQSDMAKPVIHPNAVVNANGQFMTEPPRVAEIASSPGGTADVKHDTSSSMADVVMGVMAKQKDSAEMPLTVAITKRPISQTLKSKVDGVNTNESKSQNNSYKLNSLNLPPADAAYLAEVAANTKGAPITGLGDKMIRKPDVPQTDANIGYAAPAHKDNETLKSGYYKIDNKKGKVKSQDSLHGDITSTYSTNVLNAPAAKPLAGKIAAHPVSGWDAFNAYIKKSAVLPGRSKTGSVTVKFTVWADGSISNTSVIKSLSAAADAKAINIISQSGKWAGATDGKPETVVKVIVFTAE